MRKPNEIKKGLGYCNMHQCPLLKCPYFNEAYCGETLNTDALAYIQQLERERDALLADLKEADIIECDHCRYYKNADSADCDAADCDCVFCENESCKCRDCRGNSNWQWRGVQKEVE